MTVRVVDTHHVHVHDLDEDTVLGLVGIETELGVTDVRNMIILLKTVQIHKKVQWTNYNNCMSYKKMSWHFNP